MRLAGEESLPSVYYSYDYGHHLYFIWPFVLHLAGNKVKAQH